MKTLHCLLLTIALAASTACGYSSSPASPTPTPTPPAPDRGGASVTIPLGAAGLGDRAYSPGVLTAAVGTTVTWVNTDTVAHTTTADANGWNSGALAPNQQFSTTFTTAGTFVYHCAIHPGMVGTVTVR